MDNLNFVVIEKAKIDALFDKVDKLYELLQAERVQPDKLYSNEEACQYLKVCSKTLQNYRDTGQIKFIQNGRKISYTQNELNEFIMRNKKGLFKKEVFIMN